MGVGENRSNGKQRRIKDSIENKERERTVEA